LAFKIELENLLKLKHRLCLIFFILYYEALTLVEKRTLENQWGGWLTQVDLENSH